MLGSSGSVLSNFEEAIRSPLKMQCRIGSKVGMSMFYNGTADTLLDEHENGSPIGLAAQGFLG